MRVAMSSEFVVEPGEKVEPHELARWLLELPAEVELEPVMGSRGSQRDPIEFLRGMKARWTEDRPAEHRGVC